MSTDSPDALNSELSSKSFSRTPTSWDAQDDILLMHLKDNQKLGWKEIALHFQNRTPNACQFRWRRLKSGNLKNPPKSAQALGGLAAAAMAATTSPSPNESSLPASGPKKTGIRRKSESQPPNLTLVYSPLANTTFTGYDTVSSGLGGMNSHTSNTGAISSVPQGPLGPINTTSHPQTFDNLPKLDVPLDPQTHSAAAAGTLGGYFTDISVDPTLNLPHNKPHPVASHLLGLTPRNSVDQHHTSLHNNSIIQIVRGEDRTSVLLQLRLSVLSLPLKSMNIPHHHLNSLAHLPILFGGSSILGPAGGTSILGPPGLPQLASTLSSIRNGSIVGPPQAYLRRLSMVMHDRRGSDKERPDRSEFEKLKKEKDKDAPGRKPAVSQPIFNIPWSMEEDELLINRRRKELSFAELSILLPQRTEGEIWSRIDALERLRNGHRALRDSRRRRLLLVGLDDVDDFYSEVDSVIGAIDSDDDEDNDDVLLEVDDSIPGHLRRGKKRRASSAVNPLTVREGIRRKLH